MTYYLLFGYFLVCICDSLPNNNGNRGSGSKYDNTASLKTTQELADELSNLNAVKLSEDAFATNKNTSTPPKAKGTVSDPSKQRSEPEPENKIVKKTDREAKGSKASPEQNTGGFDRTVLQKFELYPPEYIAKYIFETSDLDGVKTAIGRLVAANKITQDDANSYTSKIKIYLTKLHEEAVRNMMAMETQKAENDALTDMLELSKQMNKNAQLEKMLYDYARQLYLLFAEKDDAFSNKVLSRFMAQVQEKVKSGEIDQDVRDKIYAIVTQGITDAQEADATENENN